MNSEGVPFIRDGGGEHSPFCCAVFSTPVLVLPGPQKLLSAHYPGCTKTEHPPNWGGGMPCTNSDMV